MDANTTLSDTLNDMEILKKHEDEHLHMQRQVRMIQADRIARTMGVHPMFRRQDHLLRTLKMEYINLLKDLKIARSGAHKKKDKKMRIGLKKSLLLREETMVNTAGGLAINEELEGLLQISKKELLKMRSITNACEGEIEARRGQSEARLLSTENKLETAQLRFNGAQYENKKIREEIEHMLKDRALFNQSWDKMLSALRKGKQFLSDLFESSTLAYGQRDEWVAKLRAVQEKGKMDQMLQIQEMRDLKKSYDHEMKTYLFLAKKGVMRVNLRQQEKEEEQKMQIEQDIVQDIDKHVEILHEIKNYTQESSYNKMIADFLKREQQNFSIYELITEICAENEVLGRGLRNIRQDVEDRREWNEMQDMQCQRKLDIIRKQLTDKIEKNAELRAKCADQDKLLKDSMEKIHDIFKMLDCSLEPFQQLLGDKLPSLHQLNLTMCLITEKIKEHIETVYYFERHMKRSEKSSSSRLKKFLVRADRPEPFEPRTIAELVPADPCPSCIESRWMSRVCETSESVLDVQGALAAIHALAADPAYIRSDRLHALADCRASASRRLLATRHNY